MSQLLDTGATLMTRVGPGEAWSGTAGSGFGGSYGAVPVNPVRTTAKPACRLMVAPRQTYTDHLLVGVIAMAMHQGSLMDNLGLQKVILHYEGSSVDILRPSFQTFRDVNGIPRTYFGWWAWLKHDGRNGLARAYFEAVPKDGTMQNRVIGPFTFVPAASKYDAGLTVAPSLAEVTGERYQTLGAAILWAKQNNRSNPLITITEAGKYDFGGDQNPNRGNIPGYMHITASVPGVSIGLPAYTTDAAAVLWSNKAPIHLFGSNITLDFDSVRRMEGNSSGATLNGEGMHWMDGITLGNFSADGRFQLLRGNYYFSLGAAIRGEPWLTECHFTQIASGPVGSLVRGCRMTDLTYDVVRGSDCVVGNTLFGHDTSGFNTAQDAFTVIYEGAEATATLSRSGQQGGANGGIWTATWGANTSTFDTGRGQESYYNGTATYLGSAGGGYWVEDVVEWLNTLPGWTAVEADPPTKFYASCCCTPDKKGTGFSNLNVKNTLQQIVARLDAHPDFFQHATGTKENTVVMNNRAVSGTLQFLFASPTGGVNAKGLDMFFINNAYHRTNFDEDEATYGASQFGRGQGCLQSHVVVAHNTLTNQRFWWRASSTPGLSDWDAYCSFSNNIFSTMAWVDAPADPDPTVANNHLMDGANAPLYSVGTVITGTQSTLVPGAPNEDFAPAGALLENLKAPIFPYDLNCLKRAELAPVGALTVV